MCHDSAFTRLHMNVPPAPTQRLLLLRRWAELNTSWRISTQCGWGGAGWAWDRVHPGWGQGAGLWVTRTEHKGGQHRPPPQVPHQAPITHPPRPRANDRDDHSYWKRNWLSMLKGCHGNLLRPPFSANHRAVGTMVDVAQTALQWSRLILY